MRGIPMQYVRHAILSEDVGSEKKYWLFFIGKLFELSRKDDIEENDLQTCKSFHNNLQNLVDDNLHEMIASCLTQFREAIDRDMQLNGWTNLELVEANCRYLLKAIDYFYYVNGYFPTNDNLVTAQKPTIPSFIQADKEISPISSYKGFIGDTLHTLICTELLCALNMQLLNNLDYLGKQ